MSENELRDFLASKIDILGKDLTLLEKEAYLPHSLGTKSFVDLLAIDASKRYVLIELKRSSAASREAIHEIYKYVEAAKHHLGTRDDEIRVILASTDWRELIVPYSRFVVDTNIAVSGLLLRVADDSSIMAEAIIPLPIVSGRYLAPWHDLNLYRNANHLKEGIKSHEAYCKRMGIDDYVMLILKADGDFNKKAKENFKHVYKSTLAQFGSPVDDDAAATMSQKLTEFEYIIYFAMRLLSKEEGISLVQSNEFREEIEEAFLANSEEEASLRLHEHLSSREPTAYRDFYEIGYPSKLKNKLLEEEKWETIELRRYGVFERNRALSDESIIDELGGSDGRSKQRLKSRIQISDPAQLKVLRQQLDLCLEDNPRWRAQINDTLNEIASRMPEAAINVSVFNPCSGLITLYMASTHGIEYLPHYIIELQHHEITRVYTGFLEYKKPPRRPTLQNLLTEFYAGDVKMLLSTLLWGGYETNDTSILEYVGLTYRTAKVENPKLNPEVNILRDNRWYKYRRRFHPFNDINTFFRDQDKFIVDLTLQISSRWNGTFVDLSTQDPAL